MQQGGHEADEGEQQTELDGGGEIQRVAGFGLYRAVRHLFPLAPEPEGKAVDDGCQQQQGAARRSASSPWMISTSASSLSHMVAPASRMPVASSRSSPPCSLLRRANCRVRAVEEASPASMLVSTSPERVPSRRTAK